MIFAFGHSEKERIEVDVLRYEREPTGIEYYDDNWLTAEIRVWAGGFRGKIAAAILTGDLVGFASQLKPLYETLSGKAEFTTLEEQLGLHLVGNGKGQIELRGEIADQPGVGNRLHFTLLFDQSQLGTSISELEKVVSQFPVRPA
jgi:hypothetical protein